MSRPDKNVDHRRGPNLKSCFKRRGFSLPVTKEPASFKAGELITFNAPPHLPHVMIVSDRKNAEGVPPVFHNIGRGAGEVDVLFTWPLPGHYRWKD